MPTALTPRPVLRSNATAWQLVLDVADTVSEGAARNEKDGPVWYGTTSILVPRHCLVPGRELELRDAAARDLHVRVQVIRIAYREASQRAPFPLGTIAADLTMTVESEGLRIDIDVQAPLIVSMRPARRRR